MNNLLTLIPYASYKYHVMAMSEGEREGLFIQEHHVIALRLFLNLLPEATR